LTEDRDRLATRVAALEHDLDDLTGSVSRQAEISRREEAARIGETESNLSAVAPPAPVASLTRSSSPSPWPDAPMSTEATGIATIAPATDAATSWPPNVPTSVVPLSGYGADIGSALSLKSLHAIWHALRAAHPQLFQGLQAGVTIRDNPRSNRAELRLVVGPFADADAAAQLCAALARFRQPCVRTMFDGRLALQ
jgi:hypothetical protein